MLTVHHLGLSQSERIVWLCEELELDYKLIRYERIGGKGFAPPEYKALHPMGVAPVITDGDLVLAESGAICDYIYHRYGGGRLVPSPSDPDYADHLFWFHWCNGTFMAILMAGSVLNLTGTDISGSVGASFVADRTRRAWDMIDNRLAQAEFFGGANLTSADVMMGYGLTTSRAFRGTSIDGYPNIARYLARIGDRPAYRRAIAKAEPGMEPTLS